MTKNAATGEIILSSAHVPSDSIVSPLKRYLFYLCVYCSSSLPVEVVKFCKLICYFKRTVSSAKADLKFENYTDCVNLDLKHTEIIKPH